MSRDRMDHTEIAKTPRTTTEQSSVRKRRFPCFPNNECECDPDDIGIEKSSQQRKEMARAARMANNTARIKIDNPNPNHNHNRNNHNRNRPLSEEEGAAGTTIPMPQVGVFAVDARKRINLWNESAAAITIPRALSHHNNNSSNVEPVLGVFFDHVFPSFSYASSNPTSCLGDVLDEVIRDGKAILAVNVKVDVNMNTNRNTNVIMNDAIINANAKSPMARSSFNSNPRIKRPRDESSSKPAVAASKRFSFSVDLFPQFEVNHDTEITANDNDNADGNGNANENKKIVSGVVLVCTNKTNSVSGLVTNINTSINTSKTKNVTDNGNNNNNNNVKSELVLVSTPALIDSTVPAKIHQQGMVPHEISTKETKSLSESISVLDTSSVHKLRTPSNNNTSSSSIGDIQNYIHHLPAPPLSNQHQQNPTTITTTTIASISASTLTSTLTPLTSTPAPTSASTTTTTTTRDGYELRKLIDTANAPIFGIDAKG